MTAAIGIGICAALALAVWLYDHGLANALEAVAIRLIRHAQRIRERHEAQERRQAQQLLLLKARIMPRFGLIEEAER